MKTEEIIDLYENILTQNPDLITAARLAMEACERRGIKWAEALTVILRHAKEK